MTMILVIDKFSVENNLKRQKIFITMYFFLLDSIVLLFINFHFEMFVFSLTFVPCRNRILYNILELRQLSNVILLYSNSENSGFLIALLNLNDIVSFF